MGIFGETKKYGNGYEEYSLNGRGYAASILATLAIGAGLFAEKGLDILGDRGRLIPENEAVSKAVDKYQELYQDASPAAKFVLQYLRPTDDRTPRYEGNSGILSFLGGRGDADYLVTINKGCLKKTAYDIAGGSIEGSFSGLFSSGSVNGDVPTAAAYAYVDGKNPDQMVVKSGHDESLDLHFSGVQNGSKLVPSDKQTEDVLSTYGCEEDSVWIADAFYGDSSSDYIK